MYPSTFCTSYNCTKIPHIGYLIKINEKWSVSFFISAGHYFVKIVKRNWRNKCNNPLMVFKCYAVEFLFRNNLVIQLMIVNQFVQLKKKFASQTFSNQQFINCFICTDGFNDSSYSEYEIFVFHVLKLPSFFI